MVTRRTVPPAEDGEDWSARQGPGADQDAMAAVEAGEIRAAMTRLPDDQRSALALAYFGGYTQREIAARLEVPLGTVKSRTFAGIRRLRELLGPSFGEVADMAGGTW